MIKKEIEKFLLNVQKPGRYVGGEVNSIVKDKKNVDIRFAFCFPDTYEIGMSHLGMKILYSLFNSVPYIWCERVFAPWDDMEKKMRENNIKLYGLESGDDITNFDFIGFTLQYELSYTNVLNMLDLAGIPIYSSDRKELSQIVVAGGPCVSNCEPLADFLDIVFIGEGEEVDLEVIELYRKFKSAGKSRKEFLLAASKIEGVYVPSLYHVTYNDDKTINKIIPTNGAPEKIKKRIMKNLDKTYYPQSFVVPSIEIIHDRISQEIFRGCIRGCRFCQAGFIYRPVREKSPEVINNQCHELIKNTGYDEISLSSLSSSDYTKLPNLLDEITKWSNKENVSISLPSLRVDGFSKEITSKLKTVRKSGLTFAPEAGTQRLRDVINKNITEEELIKTCDTAFNEGWFNVKLYFMIGLPTETSDDVKGIINLGQKIVDTYYKNPNRQKNKPVKVTISASAFVPKPFTPFQWEPQDTIEKFLEKQSILKNSVTSKKINCHWHDASTSFIEAVFARGDRNLCKVLKKAQENGLKFDGWSEFFSLEKWMKIFKECNVDPQFYANRKRDLNEVLPWEHIDYGISKDFLISEYKKAHDELTTPNCREKCSNCGAMCFKGGICIEKR